MVSASRLAAIALAASPVNAFTSAPLAPAKCAAYATGARPLHAAADDASAQALSDYMAKSHEEKLRAVKDVEDKKNAEIEALKEEIDQLKSSSALATTAPASTAAAPLASVPTSELESKLASYQAFMAEYIVNAQQQKFLAVKEAELKAEKKFQERLEKLMEASGIPLPEAPAPAVVVEETSFQKRNEYILAAAAAGKSRWGDMEIERAKEQAKSSPAPAAAAAAPASSAAPTTYELRNAQVVAAAGAGKSRWGDMEVQRAKNSGGAVATEPVVEEKKSVASVTLEDRVNLGARLLAGV